MANGGSNTASTPILDHGNIYRDMSGTSTFATVSSGSIWINIWDDVFTCSASGCPGTGNDDGIMWCGNSVTCVINMYQNTAANINGGINNAWEVTQSTASASGTVANNLAYNVTNTGTPNITNNNNTWLNSGSGQTGTNNVIVASGAVNPFVNTSVFNFNLSVDSSNYNNRASLTAPYNTDAANNTFTTDRGAFQFISSGGPTSTITWGATNQVIQGFGGSNAFASASMSTANQNFFFGTGSGQLGLTILRAEIPDANSGNSGEVGNCSTVNSGCAGTTQGDMTAVVSHGGIVVGSPWSPPASMKSNGSVACGGYTGPPTTGSTTGYLLASSYGSFASWLVNWVKSMQTFAGITPYGVSVQNEGQSCGTYSTAVWTAAQYDSFIATAMEPAWSSAGLNSTVKIMFPEMGVYSQYSWASTCAGDASCYPYVGVINWHDYDATISGTNTVNATPFSNFGWPNSNPQYWETEASCPGSGGMACSAPESATITDALNWGAVVDDRLVNRNANAWMYWWLQSPTTDAQGLMDQNGAISPRAYMLGQYSKFIRPGYLRITATHNPVATVTVSAYQNAPTNAIVIVATNYGSSASSVTFNLASAPTFTVLTPVITSATQSLATLSSVAVSGNSFTYSLPAQSIITFSGTSGGGSLSAPTFTPSSEAFYPSVSVTLSASAGATICYTTDGSTPTAASGSCTHGVSTPNPVTISATTTINAIASESGFTNSSVGSATYTLTPPNTLNPPALSPSSESFYPTASVTMTASAGATICYTNNGSTPTATTAGTCSNGFTYSAPISLNATTTLNAIATQSTFLNSSVTTGVYTLVVPSGIGVTMNGSAVVSGVTIIH